MSFQIQSADGSWVEIGTADPYIPEIEFRDAFASLPIVPSPGKLSFEATLIGPAMLPPREIRLETEDGKWVEGVIVEMKSTASGAECRIKVTDWGPKKC